uniref:Uncharacterized protein n=1 Tax=Timema tahoe TaxID=61484 RepID=A0A7R9FHU3_9NEOP|nr:unnamed protein product [Timema tahoe]
MTFIPLNRQCTGEFVSTPQGAENEHIHTQLAGHPVPVQQPRHPDRERENIGDDQLRDKKAATGCEPRDGGRGDKQRYPSPVNSSDGRVHGGRRDAARAPRDPNGARCV